MPLSKNMVATLLDNHKHAVGYTHDGRTVRALQTRGLIKFISHPTNEKPWTWHYTTLGRKITRALTSLNETARSILLR